MPAPAIRAQGLERRALLTDQQRTTAGDHARYLGEEGRLVTVRPTLQEQEAMFEGVSTPTLEARVAEVEKRLAELESVTVGYRWGHAREAGPDK